MSVNEVIPPVNCFDYRESFLLRNTSARRGAFELAEKETNICDFVPRWPFLGQACKYVSVLLPNDVPKHLYRDTGFRFGL